MRWMRCQKLGDNEFLLVIQGITDQGAVTRI